jgi:poly(A) polymerase
MKIPDRLLVEVQTATPQQVRNRIGPILMQREGFHYLYEEGVIQYLIPELSDLEDYHHNANYHPEGSLYNHYCLAIDTYCAVENRTELGAWALLFHDVAKSVVAEWKPKEEFHTYILHEKVGSELFNEKYRNGAIHFSSDEADALAWVIKEHNNFCRVAKQKKSLVIVHHPHYELLCEVARADAMEINHDFYLERLEYFAGLKRAFPEMPEYSWDESSSAIVPKRHD